MIVVLVAMLQMIMLLPLVGPLSRTVQETDTSVQMVCVMFDSSIASLEQQLTVNFAASPISPTS